MLDKYLVEHCAPTLASLKSASLFSLTAGAGEELDRQLADWNSRLREKGLFMLSLRRQGDKALIYVCRWSHLRADLQSPGVAEFLRGYGYRSAGVEYALNRLRGRLSESGDFPHEIGIFLGYPLGDVVGFIRNAGKNSKCSGCWKVYCNECEAVKRFEQFRKCREIYTRLWSQGKKTVLQLVVAA